MQNVVLAHDTAFSFIGFVPLTTNLGIYPGFHWGQAPAPRPNYKLALRELTVG